MAFSTSRSVWFYAGIVGLLLFEFLRVYFIMPMPGSQRGETLDFAYALHRYRWLVRAVLLAVIAYGAPAAWQGWRRWLVAGLVLLVSAGAYLFNGPMSADQMFKEPQTLLMQPAAQSQVPADALVIGLHVNGESRAYPIRFLVYHHQVQDEIGGKPVLVTYCSVCRTGRAFEPLVEGRREQFRLVGMDHFNAMLEDAGTGSWWRQANGQAIAGPLKGQTLPELPVVQARLSSWLALHPDSQVMQADPAALANYDTEGRFERGESRGTLTRTERSAWAEKSWVVGIEHAGIAKAYDWTLLAQQGLIHDQIGATPLVLALAPDGQSFRVFVQPSASTEFRLEGDHLRAGDQVYDFAGRSLSGSAAPLQSLPAYQEFWHSWRTFHPQTLRFNPP